jgi:hypothetical protein
MPKGLRLSFSPRGVDDNLFSSARICASNDRNLAQVEQLAPFAAAR